MDVNIKITSKIDWQDKEGGRVDEEIEVYNSLGRVAVMIKNQHGAWATKYEVFQQVVQEIERMKREYDRRWKPA